MAGISFNERFTRNAEVVRKHMPHLAPLCDCARLDRDNLVDMGDVNRSWGGRVSIRVGKHKNLRFREALGDTPPSELGLSFWRRQHARIARDRLAASNPEKVVMAHGEWQRSNGRAFLEHSLAWLGNYTKGHNH